MISIKISHKGQARMLNISSDSDFGVLCAESGHGLAYLVYQGALYQIADVADVERLKREIQEADEAQDAYSRNLDRVLNLLEGGTRFTVPLGDEAHPDVDVDPFLVEEE